MSALTRSLLALAVVALLHSACAAPKSDSQCTTRMHGSMQGVKKVLPTMYILAGDEDVSLEVHSNPCEKGVVGEEVKVCDDVAATVFVPDLPLISPVVVHRNGNYYAESAYVIVTLWCRY